MFLVEAHQAGIFRIQNVAENDIGPVLGIGCPNILFPYLRETISDTVTRAGFPPVILNPVNFEAIYNQSQQRVQSEAAETKQ
jgi:preprotein translocase subunit SecB